MEEHVLLPCMPPEGLSIPVEVSCERGRFSSLVRLPQGLSCLGFSAVKEWVQLLKVAIPGPWSVLWRPAVDDRWYSLPEIDPKGLLDPLVASHGSPDRPCGGQLWNLRVLHPWLVLHGIHGSVEASCG